ncbi:hypothetical protein WN944_008889 [Citrus x changshan-huyou]|uniref:SKP1 component POZ domain-containing protein n=1 Tax=Citrus x changshan-huyou TaxID=2935761 RepID=A0AAP0MRT4_9ROSI
MSTSKKITLKSSDGEAFEVDEAVALESQTIKHMIEDDCADNGIPLPNVTSKILSKVIEYCKKHVEASKSDDRATSGVDDDLKAWDTDFVKICCFNALVDLEGSDNVFMLFILKNTQSLFLLPLIHWSLAKCSYCCYSRSLLITNWLRTLYLPLDHLMVPKTSCFREDEADEKLTCPGCNDAVGKTYVAKSHGVDAEPEFVVIGAACSPIN